jgi:vitamin B12 transporter
MHALFSGEVRGALRTKSSIHSLSAGYKRSDGYIANSDYKILNFLWQSSFNVDGSHIDIQAGVNDKKYGANTFYAAAFPNQYDDTQGLFFSIKGETNGKIKFIPQIYWSRHYDEFHLFRPGTPNIPSWYKTPNYHQTDVYGVNLNIQYISRLGITRFGGEFRNEGVLSSNLGKPMRQPRDNYTLWDNRSDLSFFAEHNFVIDKLTLSLGALYNYNTALADTLKAGGFYPAINLSYRPTTSVTIYTSWSKATRMPTFTDLYYKAGKHRGFAGLTPEYTQSVELGVRFSRSVVAANLNAFYTKGDNMIDWIFSTKDSLYHAENRSALNTFGASVDASINLSHWMGERQPFEQLRFGYQYISQISDNESQDNPISAYVSNYLRHKFTLGVEHRIIKNLTFSWNMRYQERAGNYLKYIPATATERAKEVITPYEPFVLLDLKANYAIGKLNIFVNLNNILNTTHVDFGNIPQPGFWLTGGVSYLFK